MIRKRYVFSGNVQGVGFRYRARMAARAVGVTGWVRNEYDGTVTLELQGSPEQLEQVILMIGDGLYVEIRGMEAREVPVIPEERTFVTVH